MVKSEIGAAVAAVAALAAAAAALAAPSPPTPPPPWQPSSAPSCTYTLGSDPLSWDDANTACRMAGLHPAAGDRAIARAIRAAARLCGWHGRVWVAGGNPGYDVGTCTSTKWNDWPCYELLEYVCQTASALCRPRRRPRRRWPYTRACGTAIWTRSCGTATFRCGTTGSSCSSRRRPIAGQLARLRSYGAVEPFHVSSLTAKSRVVLLPAGRMCV